jgi:hypothetical protein
MLYLYGVVGIVITLFTHLISNQQLADRNGPLVMFNMCVSLLMWPFQLVFLVITITAFQKHGFRTAMGKSIALMANHYIVYIGVVLCMVMACFSSIATVVIRHYNHYFTTSYESSQNEISQLLLVIVSTVITLIVLIANLKIYMKHKKEIVNNISSDFINLLK